MSEAHESSVSGEPSAATAKREWAQPRLQVIAGREAEANFAIYGGVDGGIYHS